MIAIINCCGSNFASIRYAFERLNQATLLTCNAKEIKKADCVVIPGVGNAESAMKSLKECGLDEIIRQLTQPVLGICLGMQIMYSFSEEGNTKCLSIFTEKVKAFKKNKQFSAPHMGWNNLDNIKKDHFLSKNITSADFLYFVHSFYAEINNYTLATNDYINNFSAIVNKDNFYGMQFHPEKSGTAGIKILQNFVQGIL